MNYQLSPLKMKVVGSHGSGWNIFKTIAHPFREDTIQFDCLMFVSGDLFTDSIMVNHDLSPIIWGICLWRVSNHRTSKSER